MDSLHKASKCPVPILLLKCKPGADSMRAPRGGTHLNVFLREAKSMSLGIRLTESQKNKYRQKGYWGDATLVDFWEMAVLSAPGKVAVVDLQGTSYTYAELDDAAGRVASFLKDSGVEPGDFVSLQIPGWAEFTVIYVACLKVGAVVNPLLPNFREEELSYILKKCESKVMFVPSHFRKLDYPAMIDDIASGLPNLSKVVVVEKEKKADGALTLARILDEYSPLTGKNRRSANDLAAVLFTSGTEGFPKGVMLTHNNIIASERAYTAAFNLTSFDVMLMPAPVSHATGFHHGVTAAFMIGAKCVLQDIFNPDVCLNLIEHERCTAGMGSTPLVFDLLRALQKKAYDISSLRFFCCGGSPVPRYLLQQSLKAGFKVVGVYGSTESVPHTAAKLDDPFEKIIYTDGCALPSVEIKVVDASRRLVVSGVEGEEASRGPNVFVGYLKEPELTACVLDADGWYYGGDLCKMDEDGYIQITGRKKDIIIRGGENISSSEVEGILFQHPNVLDVSVVGMPDPRLGEKSCAYVVLNHADEMLTLEDVKAFFKGKCVAKYKYPERIEIVKNLPRTASGKVKKYLLREDIKNKLKELQRNR